MSNIDKQALREIAAAAVGAHERLSVMPPDDIFDISLAEGTQLDADITALNALNSAANPTTVLALLDELESMDVQIANLTAERDALREGEMGDANHSNTRAAADIYFQLVEECEIPAGGSLVEYVSQLRECAAAGKGEAS
ncbi:TPA: ead/Ea22-like family protein [Escherichia coli]